MIELVDFNEIYTGKKSGTAAKAKSTRRRGKKSAPKAKPEAEAKADTAEETSKGE